MNKESEAITEKTEDKKKLHKYAKYVPIITLSDGFITSLGAGMTVKFFPLYLIQIFKIKPYLQMIADALSTFSIAILVIIIKIVSDKIGRVQSIILYGILAIICLFVLTYLNNLYIILPF